MSVLSKRSKNTEINKITNKLELENNINNAKKDLILSLLNFIIFILLMVCSIFFLFNFQIDPYNSTTISLFIFATIFYIILLISIERLIFIHEIRLVKEFRPDNLKVKGLSKSKDQKNFLEKFFELMEKFPYEYKFKGYKKTLIKYLGWALLIFGFYISVIIKESIFEFQSFNINLRNWVQYFGFNIFVCVVGCIVLYIFSRAKLNGVIKLSIVGVAILIQVEVMVDYFFFPWELPYDDILWNHFFKAFFSFLLNPDLSYATGKGHPVLMLILIILSFSYISVKRLSSLQIQNNKKYFYIFLRAAIGSFNFYVMTIYAGVTLKFSEAFLSIFITNSSYFINLAYSMLFLIYFSPLYLLILYKIIYDERDKMNRKFNTIYTYLRNQIISSTNSISINEILSPEKIQAIKKEYKPRYFLKLSIFVFLIFMGTFTLFLTIWAYPLYNP
ncbi:MAG: hypothetical protein ACTSPQ_12405 [Candidatus Helarchaeota archaeon]